MPTIPSPLADEPVAKRTRWDPLVGGGASFRTRDLVIVNPERVEFPASLGTKLFGGVFAALGLAGFVTGIVARHWAPPLFGLAFTALGGGLLYSGTAPVVFDKRAGTFRRGRTTARAALSRIAPAQHAPLDDIHALQILGERVSGTDGSYDSYELNLVLRDGRRVNVVDHGDYDTLRRDAETLSRFLGRPLWDTVAEE
jgi:hypothetical protein